MQSTTILERKDQVIKDLTETYLQITERKLFSLRLFRKKTAEEMDKGLIEFSKSIGQFRLRTRDYVKETNLTKEELVQIKSLLLIKERQLEQSLYLRFINLAEFIFPVPCGLALVVLQNRMHDLIVNYSLFIVWVLISKKLLNTKRKLQRTLNAYGAISHSFDDILETDRQNLLIEDTL